MQKYIFTTVIIIFILFFSASTIYPAGYEYQKQKLTKSKSRIVVPTVDQFLDNLKSIKKKIARDRLDSALKLIRKTKHLSSILPDSKTKQSPGCRSYRKRLLAQVKIKYFLASEQYKKAILIINKNFASQKFVSSLKWNGKEWQDPPALQAHIYSQQDNWEKVKEVVRRFPPKPPQEKRMQEYARLARVYVNSGKSKKIKFTRSPASYFLEIERLFYFYDYKARDHDYGDNVYKSRKALLRNLHKKCNRFLSRYPDHQRTSEIWWYQTLITRELNQLGANLPLPQKNQATDTIYHELNRLLFKQIDRRNTIKLSPDLTIALTATTLLYRQGPNPLPLIYWWKQKDLRGNQPHNWKGKFHYWWLLADLLNQYQRESRYHFSQAGCKRNATISDWLALTGGTSFQLLKEPPNLHSLCDLSTALDHLKEKGPFLHLYFALSSVYVPDRCWNSLTTLYQLSKLNRDKDILAWSNNTVKEIARSFFNDLSSGALPRPPQIPPALSLLKKIPKPKYFKNRPENISLTEDTGGYRLNLTFRPPKKNNRLFSTRKPVVIMLVDHRRIMMPDKIKRTTRILSATWRWSKKEYRRVKRGGIQYDRDRPPKFFLGIIPLAEERWHDVFQQEIFKNIEYEAPFGESAGFKLISGKLTPELLKQSN